MMRNTIGQNLPSKGTLYPLVSNRKTQYIHIHTGDVLIDRTEQGKDFPSCHYDIPTTECCTGYVSDYIEEFVLSDSYTLERLLRYILTSVRSLIPVLSPPCAGWIHGDYHFPPSIGIRDRRNALRMREIYDFPSCEKLFVFRLSLASVE